MPTLGFAQLLITLSGDVRPKQARIRVTASLTDNLWREVADLDAASAQIITELHDKEARSRVSAHRTA